MPLDKTLIYQAIENPSLRKNIAVEELERIQAAYPYFATAQVLLAKLYQEQNDHRFADQLQQAAIYVGDRHVLYDYLQTETIEEQKISEKSIDTIEIVESAPIIEAEVELSSQEVIAVSETQTAEIEESILEDSVLEEQSPQADKIELTPALDKIEEVEAIAEEEEVQDEEETIQVSLESSVRRAVSAAFDEMKDFEEKIDLRAEKEEENPRQIKSSEMDALERNILIEAIHSTIEQEVDEVEEEEESDLSPPAPEDQLETENLGEKSYAQLMMDRARRMEEKSQEPAAEKKSDRLSAGASPKIEKSGPKDHQKSLIDKFIREQPKITPGKVSEYINQQNLGKDSLEEDFSVVTETMAKLFAAQGKFDKARKVYRQLIALHPEKSVYFAAQLKNLNQNKKI